MPIHYFSFLHTAPDYFSSMPCSLLPIPNSFGVLALHSGIANQQLSAFAVQAALRERTPPVSPSVKEGVTPSCPRKATSLWF